MILVDPASESPVPAVPDEQAALPWQTSNEVSAGLPALMACWLPPPLPYLEFTPPPYTGGIDPLPSLDGDPIAGAGDLLTGIEIGLNENIFEPAENEWTDITYGPDLIETEANQAATDANDASQAIDPGNSDIPEALALVWPLLSHESENIELNETANIFDNSENQDYLGENYASEAYDYSANEISETHEPLLFTCSLIITTNVIDFIEFNTYYVTDAETQPDPGLALNAEYPLVDAEPFTAAGTEEDMGSPESWETWTMPDPYVVSCPEPIIADNDHIPSYWLRPLILEPIYFINTSFNTPLLEISDFPGSVEPEQEISEVLPVSTKSIQTRGPVAPHFRTLVAAPPESTLDTPPENFPHNAAEVPSTSRAEATELSAASSVVMTAEPFTSPVPAKIPFSPGTTSKTDSSFSSPELSASTQREQTTLSLSPAVAALSSQPQEPSPTVTELASSLSSELLSSESGVRHDPALAMLDPSNPLHQPLIQGQI